VSANLPASYDNDLKLLRLARELAMDLNTVETILKTHEVSPSQWETIQEDQRFLKLLAGEIEAWNAAANTQERTKLKAGMLVEEWLVEANARIHDKAETLTAKTEVVKVLTGIAQMGKAAGEGAGAERFSVTINLGGDNKIKIEKMLPHKVIEGEIVATDTLGVVEVN
jgi:hypothetical protein